MNTERETIIEKIKKLLSHTTENGATEAEAVQFALKAQKLIAEYNVSEAELNKGNKEPIEHVLCDESGKVILWGKCLAHVIAQNFRCKMYLSGKTKSHTSVPVFMGYKSDAMAARIVFDRLYRIGKNLGNKKRREVAALADCPGNKKARGKIAYDSFTAGFAEGIRIELEKQSVALMLVLPKEVKESYNSFCAENLAPAKLKDTRSQHLNGNVYEQGIDAGRGAIRAGCIGSEDHSWLLAV